MSPLPRRLRRIAGASCALALGGLLAGAAPAAAEPLPDPCWMIGGPVPGPVEIDVDGDGDPEARVPNPRAWLCIEADSGLSDPVSFTCYGGYHECVLRITGGHAGSAAVDAAICVEAEPGEQPLCTSIDSGTIPLVPVEPRTMCIGWSLATSPCMYEGE